MFRVPLNRLMSKKLTEELVNGFKETGRIPKGFLIKKDIPLNHKLIGIETKLVEYNGRFRVTLVCEELKEQPVIHIGSSIKISIDESIGDETVMCIMYIDEGNVQHLESVSGDEAIEAYQQFLLLKGEK